ncbi:hypothetical protein KIN20_029958 [Parelaphostrongylus tenuis]|uniref:Uncharacterized protein n=1 Tax=Parelaphostrongylus tenuis TaxID=148309 RepID=A0AAD5R357_PARTN|nr:hypothetical protein KIN20_029958 [Parelaphostrongylus tenuis]
MELQRSMTDCYSNSASDFPLQTSIKLKCLSTGSSIVVFSIRNNSMFDLKDWSVSVSIFPTTAEVSCSYSQSSTLVHLLRGEVFTSELFFPPQYLQLPVMFHIKLTKLFKLQNEAKYICINLGDEFLSLRDQIHQVDTALSIVDGDLPNVLGSFTLRLPCCLVDLFSGCPDEDDQSMYCAFFSRGIGFCRCQLERRLRILCLFLLSRKNIHYIWKSLKTGPFS